VKRLRGVKGDERQALEAIADVLRQARRSDGAKLQERTLIVLESKCPRNLNGQKGRLSPGWPDEHCPARSCQRAVGSVISNARVR
jgi:hypothetical protein